MDQIGFTLEHLDGAGRYRAMEGAFNIDDTGTVTATRRGDSEGEGPDRAGHGALVAAGVNSCVASYLAAYALASLTTAPLASSARPPGSCAAELACSILRAHGPFRALRSRQ